MLLSSSAAVYTGTEAESHAEAEALMPPRGAYGQAKLAMEQMARQWARGRATSRLTLLRMANVIGADSLFANLRPGAEVQLDRFASGGGPKRSYLAVDDFAHVIEHLATCADAALPEVLNVAGEKALAMSELVERGGGSVAWRTAPPTALERVELDTTLLKSLVGSLPASSDPTRAIESWQRTRVQA
ncbi:MAG TPA: NAD(P)-dependent oxidoreductase [Rhodobacterales bacterium]|nr:NAD(P)-dependent oxidoreductase [Rhodobacterales bacterium]